MSWIWIIRQINFLKKNPKFDKIKLNLFFWIFPNLNMQMSWLKLIF